MWRGWHHRLCRGGGCISNDVNSRWLTWRSKFLQVMETCIPQAVLKARRNLPWLNKSVVQAMRKCNLLFNTAKKSNSAGNWEKYKCIRNKVVAMLRWNKKQYFYNLRFLPKRSSGRQSSWLISRIPQYQLSGTAPLQSLQMMPRLNFWILSSLNALITHSLHSVILSPLILKLALLQYFAQRRKSVIFYALWMLPNQPALMVYLLLCSSKLLYQSPLVSLSSSIFPLHLARFLQTGNVQELHLYSSLPIPLSQTTIGPFPFYPLQANSLKSIFTPSFFNI